MDETITLDYAKASPRWRRWVKRVVWAMVLAGVVGTGWYWWGDVSRHVGAWYYMRQCLAYSRPAGQVAFVINGNPRVPCWDNLMEQVHGDRWDLPIFLHERVSRGIGGGKSRLVNVSILGILTEYENPHEQLLRVQVWQGGSIITMPKLVSKVPPGTLPSFPESTRRLQIFAGQADPRDDSHFTFEFETRDGGRGKVDGWLEADDSVTWVVGPVMPAATRP